MKIVLNTTRSIDDKTGRAILTFTPVFVPDVTAFGSLAFAHWQVWEDEPDTYEAAKQNAITNAENILRSIPEKLGLIL